MLRGKKNPYRIRRSLNCYSGPLPWMMNHDTWTKIARLDARGQYQEGAHEPASVGCVSPSTLQDTRHARQAHLPSLLNCRCTFTWLPTLQHGLLQEHAALSVRSVDDIQTPPGTVKGCSERISTIDWPQKSLMKVLVAHCHIQIRFVETVYPARRVPSQDTRG